MSCAYNCSHRRQSNHMLQARYILAGISALCSSLGSSAPMNISCRPYSMHLSSSFLSRYVCCCLCLEVVLLGLLLLSHQTEGDIPPAVLLCLHGALMLNDAKLSVRSEHGAAEERLCSCSEGCRGEWLIAEAMLSDVLRGESNPSVGSGDKPGKLPSESSTAQIQLPLYSHSHTRKFLLSSWIRWTSEN